MDDCIRCTCGAPIEDGWCTEACAAHGICGCMCLVIECPACRGAGGYRHPRYGSRTCPEPAVDCGYCGGTGEVAA